MTLNFATIEEVKEGAIAIPKSAFRNDDPDLLKIVITVDES